MAKKQIKVAAAPGFDVNQVRLENGDHFITVKEGMTLTCSSEPTIRRKLTLGQLRRFKNGRRTLLLYSDCLSMIKETTAAGVRDNESASQ